MNRDLINDNVMNLLSEKLDYFKIFSKLSLNGKQFKTEKWLQTELLFLLRETDYDCIPEYERCDLVVNNENGIYFWIEIKNYADSLQNFAKDWKDLKKDLKFIKNKQNSILILVLPYGRETRESYVTRVLDKINIETDLMIYKHEILKFSDTEMGIQYLIICKNSSTE